MALVALRRPSAVHLCQQKHPEPDRRGAGPYRRKNGGKLPALQKKGINPASPKRPSASQEVLRESG